MTNLTGAPDTAFRVGHRQIGWHREQSSSQDRDEGLIFLGEAIMQWQFGWYREIKASSSQRDALAIFIFRKKERIHEKSI